MTTMQSKPEKPISCHITAYTKGGPSKSTTVYGVTPEQAIEHIQKMLEAPQPEPTPAQALDVTG